MRINNKHTVVKNVARMLPLLFILAMFILGLALSDKTYSKEERRYFTRWPVFSIERLLDGSYGTRVEEYFSDQFPLREFWMQMARTFML